MANTRVFIRLPDFTGNPIVAGGEISPNVAEYLLSPAEGEPIIQLASPVHGEGKVYAVNKYFLEPIEVGSTGALYCKNMRIWFSRSMKPEQIDLAPSRRYADLAIPAIITGDYNQDMFFFDQANDLQQILRPEFIPARGSHQALTLYNSSGELGGIVSISGGTGDCVAFWVRRELTENITTGFNNFTLLIEADEA